MTVNDRDDPPTASSSGTVTEAGPPPPRPRRALGCLAGLLALAVVVAAAVAAVTVGASQLRRLLQGPEDYTGGGTGRVLVEVGEGDSATTIGETLHDAGVVKSVEAFTDAAAEDPDSRGIQVGYYQLRKEMSAAAALAVLVDPENLIQDRVTVPEGLTVDQTVAVLAEETDFTARRLRAVLARPSSLGLPAYAAGDPEGFLFPATYLVRPDATARSLLRDMVRRFEEAAADVGLVRGAAELGLSPHDVVTVASLVQREARREDDLSGVAEVVYNRLDGSCRGTGRLLQLDSTVHFAAGDNDSVFTSEEMRRIDSPYNTYQVPGLPPGPIASPGEAALRAALEPTDEGWCYFVTVDLDSGETAFARTGAEHRDNVGRLQDYCADSDRC
jgi:UPF0755 protein